MTIAVLDVLGALAQALDGDELALAAVSDMLKEQGKDDAAHTLKGLFTLQEVVENRYNGYVLSDWPGERNVASAEETLELLELSNLSFRRLLRCYRCEGLMHICECRPPLPGTDDD